MTAGYQVRWLATAPQCTGRRGTASHKAMARGTLAPHLGEQAAEGQTARLKLAKPSSRDPRSLLNLCFAKRAMPGQQRKRRRQTRRRLKHQWPDFATLLTSCTQKPNDPVQPRP